MRLTIIHPLVFFFFLTCFFPITVTAGNIEIGLLTTLTGPFSEYGGQDLKAIKVAVNQINRAGGISGNKISIIAYDTEGRPEKALSAIKMMTYRFKVVAVFGPTISGDISYIANVCDKNRIPLITATAVDPYLVKKLGKWTISLGVSAQKFQSQVIPKWTSKLGIKTVGIIFDKKYRNYHEESTVIIPNILGKFRIKLIGSASYLTGDADFTSQIRYLMRSSPDGIIINGHPFDVLNIVNALKKCNFKGPIYSSNALFPQFASKELNVDNYNQLSFGMPIWIDNTDSRVQELYNDLGVTEEKKLISPSSVMLFDAVYALKNSLERYGVSDTKSNRESVVRGLTELRNFNGIGGKFSIYKNGVVKRDCYLISIVNGEYKLVK